MSIRVIDKPTIAELIENAPPAKLIHDLEDAFTHYSSGKAVVPPVGTLSFTKPPGDVHIKYGYIKGEEHYVIKIASGFYDNPALGLSSSNGLNLVFDQKNGLLEAILLDEGLLTDVRTALAGAIAVKYLSHQVNCIGIMGTGIQAHLQLKYISAITSCLKSMVWGRTAENCKKYSKDLTNEGFHVSIAEKPEQLLAHCDLVVTTTSAEQAILPAGEFLPDALIVAIGADTIGKQELDEDILTRSALIVMDSASQCREHGEIHKAHQKGKLNDIPMLELGQIIPDKSFVRPSGLVVVDLTGIATQDMLISKFILESLDTHG